VTGCTEPHEILRKLAKSSPSTCRDQTRGSWRS
jgi:hypothetical protein